MPHFAPIHHAVDEPSTAVRSDRRTIAAFLAAGLLAGGNPVAVRISYAELAPFWAAALRFFLASVVMLAAIAVLRLSLPRGRALTGVLLYGLLQFGIPFALVYWALTEVTAGTTMIILATVPLLALMFGTAERVERLTVRGIVGALLALLGIALVFRDSIAAASPIHLLAVLGGALSMAAAPIVIKELPRVHALVENALGMIVGGVLLFGLSVLFGEPKVAPIRPQTQFALAYLVLFGSIGMFLLYLFVLRRMSASGATYVMLVAPLAAVGFGAALLGEPVHSIFLVGSVFVLSGVYVGVISQAVRRE